MCTNYFLDQVFIISWLSNVIFAIDSKLWGLIRITGISNRRPLAERLEGITDLEKGCVHGRWARDFQDILTIRNWGLDRETRVSLRSLLDVYSDVQELTQSHCESYTWTHLPPFATWHARAPFWQNLSGSHEDKGFWSVTPGFPPGMGEGAGVGGSGAGTRWTVSSLQHTHPVSLPHLPCSPRMVWPEQHCQCIKTLAVSYVQKNSPVAWRTCGCCGSCQLLQPHLSLLSSLHARPAPHFFTILPSIPHTFCRRPSQVFPLFELLNEFPLTLHSPFR